MREGKTSGAAVSRANLVSLPHADPPHGQDHLTWAYQTHVTAIYQYIYSRVGNRPDAEDLTGQVFMKAISGMRNDVSVPELRSWLYRVAQTTLADHWREYYAEGAGELDEDVTRPPTPRENPEAVHRVDTLLATLPESYRRVLELRARETDAGLHAAKPCAGLPSKEFLERMQGSIHGWVGEQSAQPQPPTRPSRRSLLLTGAVGLAAGIAAAVGFDRLTKAPAPGP